MGGGGGGSFVGTDIFPEFKLLQKHTYVNALLVSTTNKKEACGKYVRCLNWTPTYDKLERHKNKQYYFTQEKFQLSHLSAKQKLQRIPVSEMFF